MRFVPFPGGMDDLKDVGVAWFPAELFDQFFGRGDECGWIAGTPGDDIEGDRLARHLFSGAYHLEDRTPCAGADVEDVVGLRRGGFDGEAMRLGQIIDMNVIAEAGAVWGGVVVAEDHELFSLAER